MALAERKICGFCFDVLRPKQKLFSIEIKTTNGIKEDLVCRRCWFNFTKEKIKSFFKFKK